MSTPATFRPLAWAAIGLILSVRAASAQTDPCYPGTIPSDTLGVTTSAFVLGDLTGDGVLDAVSRDYDGIRVVAGTPGGGYFSSSVTPDLFLPGEMAVLDVLGSGDADLVALRKNVPGAVRVYAGQGDIQLGAYTEFATAVPAPTWLRVVDFDGDGPLDVVVAGPAAPGVQVFRNVPGEALASFAVADLAIDGALTAFDVADVDGDLDLDLVYADAAGVRVALYGSGSFAPSTLVAAPGTKIDDLRLAYLDADAVVDLAFAENGGVQIWTGQGGGAFAFVERHDLGQAVSGLRVGELTGGGGPELLAVIGKESAVVLLNGGGSFQPQTPLALGSLYSLTPAAGVTLTDVNGDQALDLVYPRSGDGQAYVSTVLGAPLAPPAAAEAWTVGASILGTQLADLDGDGAVDALNWNDDDVLIRTGDGSGGFAATVVSPVQSALGAQAAHFADLDGDGLLDLLRRGDTPGEPLVVCLATAFDTWTELDVNPVVPTSDAELLTCDWNLDGHVDALLVHEFSTSQADLYLGSATGELADAVTIPSMGFLLDGSVAWMNGDTWPDLVLSGYTGLQVVLGGGGAGLGTPLTPIDGPTNSFGIGHAVADFDGDGLLDVAVVWRSSLFNTNLGVQTFFGDGTGALLPGPVSPFAADGADLRAADLDADGAVDLVSSGFGLEGGLVVVLGDGAGGFAPASSPVTPVRAAAVHDVDADGRLDLVAVPRPGFVTPGSFMTALECDPQPAGLTSFGTGTPGCWGTLGLTANRAPAIGDADFAFVGTNAPPFALGWWLLGGGADPVGSDYLDVGALLHLDLFKPIFLFPAEAGPAGECVVPVPLPNDPTFPGLTVHVQMIWTTPPGSVCARGPYGLSSTRGLSVTFQP